MARYAVIIDGSVTNIVEAEAGFAAAQGWIPASSARIGDAWDGSAFTPQPAAPAPVPSSVTMRQARLVLLGAGLLDDVTEAINAMSEPAKTAATIEWEYSNELQRGHALVTALGAALGLTGAQVDDLFRAAQAL